MTGKRKSRQQSSAESASKRAKEEGQAANTSQAATRQCAQCGCRNTPQWREGPLGTKTLCNACGVKWLRSNKRQRESKSTPSLTTRRKSTMTARRTNSSEHSDEGEWTNIDAMSTVEDSDEEEVNAAMSLLSFAGVQPLPTALTARKQVAAARAQEDKELARYVKQKLASPPPSIISPEEIQQLQQLQAVMQHAYGSMQRAYAQESDVQRDVVLQHMRAIAARSAVDQYAAVLRQELQKLEMEIGSTASQQQH